MNPIQAYVEANKGRFLEELKAFLRQPSISAQNVGIPEMAALVRSRLERLGAQVQMLEVDAGGPPVVYAEIGEGAVSLLSYNHYDVQPPDPLDLWESPPFEPTLRDGKLYARGVADDKGDLMARIQAVETYLAVRGRLPLKFKFFVEGEEETGSPHLGQLAQRYRALVRSDGCLWEGGGKDEAERPTLHLGLKGIQYVELRARGAKSDMHSSLAAIVPNPAWRLVWALNTLKTPDDRITLDGMMDHVRRPTQADLDLLAAIPFEEEKMRANWGIPAFVRGLTGLDALVKLYYEPTCTICGLRTGYIEQGMKTVLPSEAVAKVDFRLVPDLTPDLVLSLLRAHLDRRGFTDIEIVPMSAEHPASTPVDAPLAQSCIAATEAVYGSRPVIYPVMAGSGPMYPLCQQLGMPGVVGVGVTYPGINIHAPNENIRLADYWQNIEFVCALIDDFSARAA
jgi:acetylornithine deacetylase/succinyl-diaminopimelate desuccinylase-like protein